ncbi:MAG TPA: glycosyl transferase family protein [Allosphingosinicella sp.]|nr:glycosyl transferase family protein [Allosphingosinicella sp.]
MGAQHMLVAAADLLMRECALFAACGFLLLGLSDILVDLLWIARLAWRRAAGQSGGDGGLDSLPVAAAPGRIAVFVPAWDEAEVIAPMLRHALRAWADGDFVIFVGCYPNDPATADAVGGVGDARVRAVIGPAPGPTTKADCLNTLWAAMPAEEGRSGGRFKAVALHDAEDVVHSAELRVFDALVERFELVQLPVLPLIDRKSRWIAGHYADEFAEAHGKGLVVRGAIGAALPSAGVGCAIRRETLERLAAERGSPFDADSLTEDYELGLRLRRGGGRAAFVRLRAVPGGPVVATREYFPATLKAAVSQKARWMRGIALSGWERLGWSGGIAERWMRMRDRQSVLAALLLVCGYLAFVLWSLRYAGTALGLAPIDMGAPLQLLLLVNGALLFWRLAMRFGFVAEAYGWREGLRSVPRALVANAVEIGAAARAVSLYARQRGPARWDKTRHAFPAELPAE